VGITYDDKMPLNESIKVLINNHTLQQKLSNNALKLYNKEFNFDKVYDDLVLHLEKMATKKIIQNL